MQIDIPTEKAVIHEALYILMNNMEPLKIALSVAACKLGEGDYLKIKDQLFVNETVDSLYAKIQTFEASK